MIECCKNIESQWCDIILNMHDLTEDKTDDIMGKVL